jgi:hypothetical protein
MAWTTVADYVKHPRYGYDATILDYQRKDDVVPLPARLRDPRLPVEEHGLEPGCRA